MTITSKSQAFPQVIHFFGTDLSDYLEGFQETLGQLGLFINVMRVLLFICLIIIYIPKKITQNLSDEIGTNECD